MESNKILKRSHETSDGHKGFSAYPKVYPWVCKSTQGYAYVYSSPGIQVNIPRSIRSIPLGMHLRFQKYSVVYPVVYPKILSGILRMATVYSRYPSAYPVYTQISWVYIQIPQLQSFLGYTTNVQKLIPHVYPYGHTYPDKIEYTLEYASVYPLICIDLLMSMHLSTY